jgi:outer membrane protein
MAWSFGGLAIATLLAVGAQGRASEPPGPRIDLEQAISRALANHPRLRGAQAKLDEARAARKSARAHYAPKVQLEAHLLRWDVPSRISVLDAASVDLSGLSAPFQSLMGPLLAAVTKPLEVRHQTTGQVSISLAQPLTPLYSVHQGHQMATLGEKAAKHALIAKRRDVVYQTTEAYYRLLQAQAVATVAREAVDTLTAHLADARKLREAGLIGPDDVLTADVELASAREALIRAQDGVSLARSALATLVGAPVDAPLEIVPVPEGEPPGAPLPLSSAEDEAIRSRPELKALRAQSAIAKSATRIAWWKLTPQISLVARYQRTEGNILQQPNESFIGGMLHWNLWDWGATYHEARATEAREHEARARLCDAEDLVRLEVKQRFLGLDSARARLAVAAAAERQAEEALRVARLKFQHQTVASTAVLDAQTRLSRARASRVAAHYDRIVALAALRRALGESFAPTVLPRELAGATPRS